MADDGTRKNGKHDRRYTNSPKSQPVYVYFIIFNLKFANLRWLTLLRN